MAKKVERGLAAVLAADVVGYSRLMEADEAGTLVGLEDACSTSPGWSGPDSATRSSRATSSSSSPSGRATPARSATGSASAPSIADAGRPARVLVDISMISAHHATVSGVLRGLAVKMSVWQERFGNDRGGPQSRADFVMSGMKHGIDKIDYIEQSAPKNSDG